MIPRNLLISSRSSSAAIAFFHTSARRAAAQPKHTSETYNKDDSDMSPPPDSKIHRVDPNSDSQKPHEAPSGPYSRVLCFVFTAAVIADPVSFFFKVGAESAEYKNTNSKYNGDHDTRYGGKKQYNEDKGPETSKPDEGPAGKSSQGRKPEGR
ncbi:hypothetical protein GG344DRAFT_73377 [Lentinula edodes]|nr:hypothetical protein GG344DRAFT_73377 [Lentinula edodes]